MQTEASQPDHGGEGPEVLYDGVSVSASNKVVIASNHHNIHWSVLWPVKVVELVCQGQGLDVSPRDGDVVSVDDITVPGSAGCRWSKEFMQGAIRHYNFDPIL